MARPLRIDITESLEELKHRLRHDPESRHHERLQMLYWLKQGLVSSRQQLSQLLNRTESTITCWLNAYRQGGLAQLLEVKTAPGKPRTLSPEMMEKLKERLQDPRGVSSYKEIWQWLREQGVEIGYSTVHRIVRYQLKAKLKVPRPRHHKQHHQAIEQFKQT